ncbi:hypothetical protein ACOMHN_038480 [Nucella lapillus]
MAEQQHPVAAAWLSPEAGRVTNGYDTAGPALLPLDDVSEIFYPSPLVVESNPGAPVNNGYYPHHHHHHSANAAARAAAVQVYRNPHGK